VLDVFRASIQSSDTTRGHRQSQGTFVSLIAVPVAAAGEDHREIGVVMGVGVAHAGAEKHHGVIEQLAVAVVEGAQLGDEARELLHLVFLHLKQAFDVFLHLAMVGEGVVALAQAEGRGFEAARDLQGGDARRVGLQGERNEIVEHRQVRHEVCVDRLLHAGLGLGHVGPALAELHLLLHVAHGG